MKTAILLISLLISLPVIASQDSDSTTAPQGTQSNGTPIGVNSAPDGTTYR